VLFHPILKSTEFVNNVEYVSVASHVLSALNPYINDVQSKLISLAVTFIVSFCTGPAAVESLILHVGAV